MEELFFTGYCRALDQSRTVCLELASGDAPQADCAWPSCPYAPSCPLAKEMTQASSM